ncbi:FAD:protein FMN transferase [Fibrobacterota bacterium]
MKKKIVLLIILAVCSFVVIYGIKNYRDNQVQKQTRFVMSTYCTIQIPGKKDVIPYIEKAFERIEEIDKKFSALNPESPLFTFNQEDGVCTDKEIGDLVKSASQISKDSEGSFDITVFPLMKLWGFYSGKYSVPEKDRIDELLTIVGYQNVVIREDTLVKTETNAAIDLGGIAKGYALKEAVNVLKKSGISSALIDAGGDIYALGTFRGKPWKIGIRKPRGEGVFGVLELSDYSVVTSGDYERFFEKDGVIYHHILNPKTGYPARSMVSVTVICKDPVRADAWSTALFVMESEKALSTIEKTANLEAVLITAKGEVLCSSGLKDNLEMSSEESK